MQYVNKIVCVRMIFSPDNIKKLIVVRNWLVFVTEWHSEQDL